MKSETEALQKHVPEDTAPSFEERMRTLIKNGGRYGEINARKEVYKANTKLITDWRNGVETGIDFGDYSKFLADTKLYDKEFHVDDIGTLYPETETGCENIDCVDMAEQMISEGYNPAILNLASAIHPGGGYENGNKTQEESLCRSSNLSISLYQYGNPNDPKKKKAIRDSGVAHRADGYPLDLNYGGIYTPSVTFFRYGKSKTHCFGLREKPFQCAVITVAALSFNDNHVYSDNAEHRFKDSDNRLTPEGNEVMLNKIRTIFRMGVENGHDSLVLGAFGCGVYALPVDAVAGQFRTVMEEPEFRNKFRKIVFAILEGKRGPVGPEGKFAGFYREFSV